MTVEGGERMGSGKKSQPANVREARVTLDYAALSEMGRKGARVKAERKRQKQEAEAQRAAKAAEAPQAPPETTEMRPEWKVTAQHLAEARAMIRQRHGDPDD